MRKLFGCAFLLIILIGNYCDCKKIIYYNPNYRKCRTDPTKCGTLSANLIMTTRNTAPCAEANHKRDRNGRCRLTHRL